MLATELPPLKMTVEGISTVFLFLIGRKDDGRRKIIKKALKRELARRQIVLDKNAERDFCIYIRALC